MVALSRPDTVSTPDQRESTARLLRLDGPHELQAAVLALLLPTGNAIAVCAWHAENHPMADAGALQTLIAGLPGPARLPWFEYLLSRMRLQPLDARQNLLEATRRLMAACGRVRPLDRLHWLEMRRRLGDPGNAPARTSASVGATEWDEATVAAIACYSAFLAQMIPFEAQPSSPSAGTGSGPGAQAQAQAQAWYATAMAAFGEHGEISACCPPDTDGMLHALQALQLLPWMQQPVLVRNWYLAAVAHSRHRRLSDAAADALRLTAALLDSPLPPELERHFDALPIAAGPTGQNHLSTR